MKRIFVLLLSLGLLLSACSAPAVKTDLPTERSGTDSTQAETPTAEQKAPTPPADVSVRTDYSNYSPKQSLQPMYTPGAAPVFDLQPSEDYGVIYPYAGSTVETLYGDQRRYYGMVDAAGQILTEPVYSSVELLQSWDYWWGTAERTLPVWLLGKTEADGDGVYGFRYAIATLDGSVVTDCCYSYVQSYQSRILAMQEQEEDYRFDIYSEEGALLLRSESLPILEKISEPIRYVSYADGMLRLDCYNESGVNGSWYTDLQGTVLLGPYGYGEDFSEGLALVTDESDFYYYIDKEGNVQFGNKFTYATEFLDGVAVVADENGQRRLIDTGGDTVLQEGPGEILYREMDLYSLVKDDSVDFYNARGELLYQDLPTGWSYVGRGVFSDWSKELIHGDSRKRFTVSRSEDAYHYAIPLWDLGIEAIRLTLYGTEQESRSYLISAELEPLMEIEGELFTLTSLDRSILVARSGSNYSFYNEELQFLFSCTGEAVPAILCNDRVLFFSEQYSLAYSLEGELLFCYPLPGFGGD